MVEPRGIIVKQNGSPLLVLCLGGKLTDNQRGQFKDCEGHPIVGIGDIKAENWWSKEIGQARNRCKRRSGSLPEAEPEGDKKDDQYIEGGGCGKVEVQVIRRKAHKQDYGRSNGRSAEGSKHCAYFRAGHLSAYRSVAALAGAVRSGDVNPHNHSGRHTYSTMFIRVEMR